MGHFRKVYGMKQSLGIFLSRSTVCRHFSAVVKGNNNGAFASMTATQQPNHDQSQPIRNKEAFRARLKSTTLDNNLLRFLDDNKLGYLTTRRTRKKVAAHYREREELEGKERGNSVTSTKVIRKYPFNKPAKKLVKLDDWFPEKLPTEYWNLPQVAIVGRSNVGKSTLLNYLSGFDSSFVQKSPMSDKPGETKSLVFYHLGRTIHHKPLASEQGDTKTLDLKGLTKRLDTTKTQISSIKDSETDKIEHTGLMLVDMPGYGFAFMNEEDTQRCHTLSMQYLLSPLTLPQVKLQRVLLLLDARHGLKQTDVEFLHKLYESYRGVKSASQNKLRWKLQIVLTKCDLVERLTLCKLMTILKQDIVERFPSRFIHDLPILPISVKDEKGMSSLLLSLIPIVYDPSPLSIATKKY